MQKIIRIKDDRGEPTFALVGGKSEISKATPISDWEFKIKEPFGTALSMNHEITPAQIYDAYKYQLIEHKNCYYDCSFKKSSKQCILQPVSNFILKGCYHVKRSGQPRRVIEIIHESEEVTRVDIDTKDLTSLQRFKEITEGLGGHWFSGNYSQLSKIKRKVFKQELPCEYIESLGWYDEFGFFVFSNGILADCFHAVDSFGIVNYRNKNFFVPCHPETTRKSHENEKRFRYNPSSVAFTEWVDNYCQAFGEESKLVLLFALATIHSDVIFRFRRNFPLLYGNGEPGSGKTRSGTDVQHLWGIPQTPLKLNERANTDKAKIRKLAQYANALIIFEEFANVNDIGFLKTLCSLYDRFGYERSSLESKYGTESVPITSTVFITGNEIPIYEPLLQRLILLEFNVNEREHEAEAAFAKLDRLNRAGLGHILANLLGYREHFAAYYQEEEARQFELLRSRIKKEMNRNVPDRIIENYAVLLTTYVLYQRIGLDFPFTYEDIEDLCIKLILRHADYLTAESSIQRFWDIVNTLVNEQRLVEGREFRKANSEIYMRWKEVHNAYLEKHRRIYYSAGLSQTALLKKLGLKKIHLGYKSYRFPNISSYPIGCQVFDLTKTGVDLVGYNVHERGAEHSEPDERAEW